MIDPPFAAPLRPRPAALPLLTRCIRRAGLGLSSAALAGLVVAGVEAWWAAADVPLTTVFGMNAGLLAPVALAWGAGVVLFGLVLGSHGLTPFTGWGRALERLDAAARRRTAGTLFAAGVGVALWATGVAHVARGVMASEAARASAGLTLAVMTALLAAATCTLVVAAGEVLASAMRRLDVKPSPGLACALGAACGVAILAWGVAQGDTSGENGWLGIWGVLKRAELDVRAPVLLLAIAGVTLGLPAGLRRLPTWCACACAALPLVLTFHTARQLSEHPGAAAAIERGAPLGKVSLALLRRLFDRDGDGASAWFGGGDCDDTRSDVHPAALDLPGNGLDEDCSGGDVPARELRPSARSEPARGAQRPGALTLPKGLNVVFITVDTLRGDLGYVGNPKPLSPNLDALAASAAVFERAYALASYTGKSVGPMLIGKYPSETQRGWGHFNRYSKDTMVAERLRARGVRTLGVHAHWYFSVSSGLGRGFDVWDASAQPPRGPSDTDSNVTGAALTSAAIRQLQSSDNTSRRFFAWVHYFDPHAAYVRHDGAPDLGTGMRAAYDGEVWYTDAQIGRLLRFIEKQPWAARTAIVLTSDHGEAFGEHRVIRHGVELYEELVRVPLLVYVPGLPPRRVTARRSAIDIAPTLLELFELPLPDPASNEFVSGRSLLDDLLAPPGSQHDVRDVFIDMPAGPFNDERRALIRGDHKLYVSSGVRFQLFDLARDPEERLDLASNKALLAEKRAEYQAFRGTLREVFVKPEPKKSD